MIQDVPPDMWDRLPEVGGSMGTVGLVAWFAVKSAFNGVRSDVKAIKEAVEQIARKQIEHDAAFNLHHERHESLRERVRDLEEK